MIRIPKIIKNKYFYTSLAFIIWLLFFDSNNLIYQSKLSSRLKHAEEQEEFYRNEIKNDSIAMHNLTTDIDNLEKFAREKYLMKKEDEEIYLIFSEEED